MKCEEGGREGVKYGEVEREGEWKLKDRNKRKGKWNTTASCILLQRQLLV